METIIETVKEFINPTEIIAAPTEVVEVPLVSTSNISVYDQQGNFVKAFDNNLEACTFAGDNGYQVRIG